IHQICAYSQQRTAESIQALQVQIGRIVEVPKDIAGAQVESIGVSGKTAGEINSARSGEVISQLARAANQVSGGNVDDDGFSGTGIQLQTSVLTENISRVHGKHSHAVGTGIVQRYNVGTRNNTAVGSQVAVAF